MHRRAQHVLHRLGFLFLDEYHRELHDISHHNRRSDAASLDGDNLVEILALETADKLLAYLVHQHRIHLMVDETIDLQNTAGITAAILHNALL